MDINQMVGEAFKGDRKLSPHWPMACIHSINLTVCMTGN